jgi:HD-like signal output (HDOD) protein
MSTTYSRSIDPRLLDQLPTLPGTAVEFLRLCDDPMSGVKDVAQVAQRDPALLARILQVANSPFYSPREPVTDAVRASAILGLRSLKMIGVGFAILGDLWTSTAKSEQLSGIIGASTMAGSAARSFSARIRTGRDEEAMTSGLLPYVGELALLRRFPDEFVEAWTSQGGLPTLEHQRETMGVDGARVGEALMGSWPIPEDLCDGVRARSQPLADRLRRTPNVFDAALGFGTAISGLLAARSESALEAIRPFARDWGLSDDDLMTYWAELHVAPITNSVSRWVLTWTRPSLRHATSTWPHPYRRRISSTPHNVRSTSSVPRMNASKGSRCAILSLASPTDPPSRTISVGASLRSSGARQSGRWRWRCSMSTTSSRSMTGSATLWATNSSRPLPRPATTRFGPKSCLLGWAVMSSPWCCDRCRWTSLKRR